MRLFRFHPWTPMEWLVWAIAAVMFNWPHGLPSLKLLAVGIFIALVFIPSNDNDPDGHQ
jgi:hypothetical protein